MEEEAGLDVEEHTADEDLLLSMSPLRCAWPPARARNPFSTSRRPQGRASTVMDSTAVLGRNPARTTLL
jgi:hypothetical protein